MNFLNNKRSFTLVETLITVLLSTVVFAGVYSTYIVGNRAWGHYNDAIAVRREVRRAMFWMVKELRAAENVRVVQGPAGSAVYFYNASEGAVSYLWDREGENANRIIRRNRAGQRILAQDISALSFKTLDGAVVINVMASKKTSKGQESHAVMKEKVALRAKTAYFR